MFPSSTGVPVAPLQFVMAGRPLAAVAARFVLATETFAGLAALWFTVGFLSPACLGFLTFPAGAAVDVPGLATSGTVAALARATATPGRNERDRDGCRSHPQDATRASAPRRSESAGHGGRASWCWLGLIGDQSVHP